MSDTQEEMQSRIELEWLFNDAEAACGLKSNWDSMVRAALYPGGHYVDPYTPYVLLAVDKRRDLSNAFYATSKLHQSCLFYLFGPNRMPKQIELIYKELSGAALATRLDREEELIKLCGRVLTYSASAQDKIQISQIRMEAINLRKNALNEYRIRKQAQED